ncbi:MAG TPA: DEAD/DEAH box helicase family protein, partial [Bacteroidota bacterium]|nr:DEAD/DEAH box helicase family protein [Bacteroidota bacterium]
MPNKAEIAAEIAREERRMAELRAESERTARRLETLKSKLATDQSEGHETAQVLKPGSQPTEILTIPEKITLFRTLFRGREDVFARRWENLRTGKTGYAPACTNDFKRGICEKLGSPGEKKHPGLVCGTCRRQAFIPVSDDEIERHLRGGQLMGIYPLLLDERCWLLAIDFDGDSWLEDLQSYSDVCTREGVPVSRERSRSGHGGHLWIFFGEAVPAYTARALGSFLLTETISHRHQVSLGSYDRFFPNQDTLPTGGFGNLIALPLQRQPRDKGNTVFLNQSLTPYSDQWEYLRSVKRVDREIAFELASSAQQRKTIIAVPEPSAYPDLLLEKPDRTTLSSASKPASMGHWPSSIIMVLSHRLYVPKAGLPSALIATLKSFAAFQNPEFYRRQGMRLSTALTPRIISCFEETDSVLALPRGCLDRVSELIRELGITLHIDDQRESGSFRSFEFKGKLSSLESEAAEALLKHEMGVFVAPPGLGKTVVGAFLIAARKTSTLVLVHRQELLRLWVIQLAHFLGIETKEIGRLGAGTKSLNGQLDVAMVPSVIHRGEVRVPLSSYGHVVADECHHVSSVSFEQVLNSSNPRFLTGLTATPQRRDGHHPIIYMQLGPVRYSVAPRRQAGLHQFEHRLIVRETPFDVEVHTGSKAPI